MHSNRSEHGHSRPYNERSSRQRDIYEDRREWLDPHRDVHCDSQNKNGVNGHGSTWRTSGSKGYSDSPKRLDGKDSLNRERSRKSPVRRRMSSPDPGTSEHKRRRFTESDEEDYRSRRIVEGKASRQSPNTFSHSHNYKDLKPTLPEEEDFLHIKETQESRHGYRRKESTHGKQYGVLTCRQSSGYCKDRDGHDRSWDHSFGRTRPQDHSMKYCESDVHQNVADPEQKRSTKGFQRFLDVLNKGVNISMLNMIMTQNSTNEDDQSQSPTSFMNTGDHSWSPSFTEGRQGSHQTTSHWSEREGSPRRASPQPEHRSFSPKKCSLSDEKSLQRGDGAKACFTSNSRTVSPSEVEKTTLKPEHKHKHMQDVLQAIGMNLGFEELGQMSHRIQERLYGKRDGIGDRQSRESRERDTMQAFLPIPQDGSSSGRSNYSPTTQEYYTTNESHSAQREETGVHQVQVDQTIEYDQSSNSVILHKGEKFEMESQQSTAYQAFSQNPSCTMSKPFPPPLTQMFPPVNCSPLLYTAPPPTLPHGGPRFLLPCMPPLFRYPHVPPLNIFPAILGQTRHLLPQHHVNPQSVFNLPIQSLNTQQKPKTLSRPRCLQVIETKQTG